MPVAIRSLQSLPERHGPTGRQGKRIATPACGLVRNDVGCFTLCVFTLDVGELLARPVRAGSPLQGQPGTVYERHFFDTQKRPYLMGQGLLIQRRKMWISQSPSLL